MNRAMETTSALLDTQIAADVIERLVDWFLH
jgi:hypothetical protein